MTKMIDIAIEATPRKSFASAIDWPGWSRSGKTEALALDALAAYAPRYAEVAERARVPFQRDVRAADFTVIEHRAGGSGTEFGVPSLPSKADGRSLTPTEAKRLAKIVAAAWDLFDRVAAGAPAELRKGPRGGGRDTANVVAHVMESDRAYAHEIGLKVPTFEPDDRAAARKMREAMLAILADAREGSPLAGRRWPARYAAHRIAWHALDHAWEIQDRSDSAE